MTATLCPHGLTKAECLICPTLATTSGDKATSRGRKSAPATRWRAGGVGGVGVVVVLLLVAWWVAALLSMILRLATLAVIGVGSGWIGWRLGVSHGRRSRRD